MIQTELLKNGTLIKHWSDLGVLIRQEETGAEYSEAIDVVPCRYTYTETDKPIEPEPEPEPEAEKEA